MSSIVSHRGIDLFAGLPSPISVGRYHSLVVDPLRLPAELDPFQSMVSLREHDDGEPHLGLGLYLVRLIAAFHGGDAQAHNLPGGGVRISMWLPQAGGMALSAAPADGPQ